LIRKRSVALTIVSGLFLSVTGCGDEQSVAEPIQPVAVPTTIRVQGTVTLNGEPWEGVHFLFGRVNLCLVNCDPDEPSFVVWAEAYSDPAGSWSLTYRHDCIRGKWAGVLDIWGPVGNDGHLHYRLPSPTCTEEVQVRNHDAVRD